MNFLKIEPCKKSITPLDENSELALKATECQNESTEVENGIYVISFPDTDHGFFYYVVQNGDEGRIHTFKGMGIVFGERILEEAKRIKDNIVW